MGAAAADLLRYIFLVFFVWKFILLMHSSFLEGIYIRLVSSFVGYESTIERDIGKLGMLLCSSFVHFT